MKEKAGIERARDNHLKITNTWDRFLANSSIEMQTGIYIKTNQTQATTIEPVG